MSIEDGRIYTPGLMVGLIEKISGDHPDLFEPAILSNYLNVQTVAQILEGGTPGLISPEDEAGQRTFLPLFSRVQLESIRETLGIEFQVEIPKIEIVEYPYIITQLPEATSEEEIQVTDRVKITKTTFTVKKDGIHYQGPTFKDVFGFDP